MRLTNRGFTLSELMLAAMILVFCLTSILSLFMNSTVLNQSNGDMMQAATHCQYVLEDISNTPFSQIAARLDAGEWNLSMAALAAAPYNFSVLPHENITVSVFQAGLPLGISVNVTYKLQGRIPRAYELRTLLSN